MGDPVEHLVSSDTPPFSTLNTIESATSAAPNHKSDRAQLKQNFHETDDNMASNQQRIVLVIEFDGRPYCGWQRQSNGLAVQEVIEQALHHIDPHASNLVTAGRTDTGVHALAIAAHVDVSMDRWQRAPRAYLHGINQHLPDAIRVVATQEVENTFHARFDCMQRSYRYLIWNRTTAAPALSHWRHWWMPRPLDLNAMQQAASHCLGNHDFSALRAAGCQANHANRCINLLNIEKQGFEITIEVAANAFLYHMVRTLVGTLVEVGTGQRTPDSIRTLLAAGDRNGAGKTAPAHGLYFIDACYHDFSSAALANCG
ncbi:MAG: tRNA pseudouridine(38-40) synthase TruA [Mariprofundales bacterium]